MKRYTLALDLKDDPALIAEYENWHRHENGWPEIRKSIEDAGITNMEIYRTGNRLFMIMETTADFSFERKAKMDATNPKVQEWEQLMWKFQQPLSWAKEGEKWVLMKKIFQLHSIKNNISE
jgi:L-rhamnose mutarotase